MREQKYRAWNRETKKMWWFDVMWGNTWNPGSGWVGMVDTPDCKRVSGKSINSGDNRIQVDISDCDLMQYTGLKDKNGKDAAHFDIANSKYLLYLDLVYGLYLIDISNGAIIRYKEGIIDEITGNYFEQHEEVSKDCQRSIDQLISKASRAM